MIEDEIERILADIRRDVEDPEWRQTARLEEAFIGQMGSALHPVEARARAEGVPEWVISLALMNVGLRLVTVGALGAVADLTEDSEAAVRTTVTEQELILQEQVGTLLKKHYGPVGEEERP